MHVFTDLHTIFDESILNFRQITFLILSNAVYRVFCNSEANDKTKDDSNVIILEYQLMSDYRIDSWITQPTMKTMKLPTMIIITNQQWDYQFLKCPMNVKLSIVSAAIAKKLTNQHDSFQAAAE